jgi:hypothetical protein
MDLLNNGSSPHKKKLTSSLESQGPYIYERIPVEKGGGGPCDDILMTMAFTTTPWSLPRIRHGHLLVRATDSILFSNS